jgi:hypothetical protein
MSVAEIPLISRQKDASQLFRSTRLTIDALTTKLT